MNAVYYLGMWLGDELAVTIYALMVACLMPFIWTVVAKITGGFKPRDNQNPRAFLANTTKMAARANAAQANSFESLPMFLAATLMAMYCFVPQVVVNGLVWLYVGIRLMYGLAYVFNLATLRSMLWFLSMACIMMLFGLSIKMI